MSYAIKPFLHVLYPQEDRAKHTTPCKHEFISESGRRQVSDTTELTSDLHIT